MKKQLPYLILTVFLVLVFQIYKEGGFEKFSENHFQEKKNEAIEKPFFVKKEKPEVKKKYIYKWTDAEGRLYYSNTNFPKDNPTLEIKEVLNPISKETKYIARSGGGILLPVTVEHYGVKETIRLMLDTGCSITQIHPDVIQRLEARELRKGKSFIADGSTMDTTIYQIDSLKVGSFEETDFVISSNEIKEKHGIDGLLGMNFLSRHPFTIDKKNRVIRWE